jgi:cold shock CspA family protein
MQQGTVKSWLDQGFGFIKAHDGCADIFVHRSQVRGSDGLPVGARVAFDAVRQPDGRVRAMAVRVTE